MKLAFSTLPCDGWSVEQLLACCKTGGFAGIEIREGPDSLFSLDSDPAETARAAAALAKAGVAVTDIGSGICVRGLNDEWPMLEQSVHRYIAFADTFQAKGIRIFTGNFCRRRDDPRVRLDYAGIVANIRKLCALAAASGKEIWVESHNEFATGSSLYSLLSDVDKENCRVIWDIIHPIEDGEPPEITIRELGDSCAHVHIKDGLPPQEPLDHDWFYTKLGEGTLPIAKIVALLKHSGYNGYLSLEWESKWRGELRQKNYSLDAVLQDYADSMRRLL